MDRKKCECGGIMWHSDDMEDPFGGNSDEIIAEAEAAHAD